MGRAANRGAMIPVGELGFSIDPREALFFVPLTVLERWRNYPEQSAGLKCASIPHIAGSVCGPKPLIVA